jgi:hypothetical protein
MIKFKLRAFRPIFEGSSLILGAVGRTTLKALAGFGAYARAIARNSLGKGNLVSAPDQPPTSRTKMLKNSIRFGVEAGARNVVIGPIILRVSKKVKDLVPPLLEYGGRTSLMVKKKFRKAVYRARPFMGPALRKSLPELGRIWQKARRG